MKKFITTLLSLALVIGMCPAMIANAETTLSGTGAEGDPYIIATADDLKAARDLINADTDGTGAAAAYYEVTADIDLENEAWTPIAPVVPFSGNFEGGEHVISNVNVEMNNDNASQYTGRPGLGFFGRIENGTIKNLGIENVSVVNNAQWVAKATCSWEHQVYAMGGFAGIVHKASVVENCFVKNAVIDQNQTANPTSNGVGGFVGGEGNSLPTYTNCYVYNATVTSASRGSKTDAYPDGNKADAVGGFLGTTPSAIKMTNCYAANVKTDAATTALASFYGFAKVTTESTSTVVTNCYSESDDIAGARTVGVYNASYSRGTVGATKEAIVEAMTEAGYATDATVNDGYPCLAWELPEVQPWDGKAATAFAGGDGTEANPYKITTAAELKLAADTVNNSEGISDYYWFSLENDIDYENNHWTPIGYSNTNGYNAFRGGFDGNGHVVKNLSIEGTYAYYHCGFFGWVIDATITDLGVDNLTIKVTNYAGASSSTTDGDEIIAFHIAGFAAKASQGSTISGCYVKNSHIEFSTGFPTGAQPSAAVSGFINSIDVRDTNSDETVDTVSISDCYVLDTYIQSKVQAAQCGFIGMFESVGLNKAVSGHTFTDCYVDGVTTKDGYTVYAFGSTGSGTATGTGTTTETAGVTVTNCHSTLTSGKGSNGNARVYHVNYDFGTSAQSKSAIATAFASLANWQDGENINAGLPALAWEPAPVILPYVVKQVSTAKDTVTLEINKADTTGDKIYIATYDSEGRLVAADVQNVATTITTAVDSAATVKVFIWNNNNPVIDAVVKASY